MPSDCQCSAPCRTEVRTEVKVLNNKRATARIKRLEKELEELIKENASLRRRLRSAKVDRKKIISDLKSQLDRV